MYNDSNLTVHWLTLIAFKNTISYLNNNVTTKCSFLIPATKRYTLFSLVPASFVARQVNQPLSCSDTLLTTSVPFDKTVKRTSLVIRFCDLYHLMEGAGIPVAWHENMAVFPLGMVWFIGDITKFGGTADEEQMKWVAELTLLKKIGVLKFNFLNRKLNIHIQYNILYFTKVT